MDSENVNNKKSKRKIAVSQIIFMAVAAVLLAVFITVDCLCVIYKPLISSFLGCAEQLDTDDDNDKINEGAKSGDQVVRNIANEGVVLMKNDGVLPLPENKKI